MAPVEYHTHTEQMNRNRTWFIRRWPFADRAGCGRCLIWASATSDPVMAQLISRVWVTGWVLPYTPTNAINNHQTQIRQSLVKVFLFFHHPIFFLPSWTCATALLYLRPWPNLNTFWFQSNSGVCRRVAAGSTRKLLRGTCHSLTWPFCTWLNSGLDRNLVFIYVGFSLICAHGVHHFHGNHTFITCHALFFQTKGCLCGCTPPP